MKSRFALGFLVLALSFTGCSTSSDKSQSNTVDRACASIQDALDANSGGSDPIPYLQKAADIFRSLSASSDKMAEYAESVARSADDFSKYTVKVLQLDENLYQFCGLSLPRKSTQSEADLTEVPDLMGLSEKEARNKVDRIFLLSISYAKCKGMEDGIVIGQSPESGAKIPSMIQAVNAGLDENDASRIVITVTNRNGADDCSLSGD